MGTNHASAARLDPGPRAAETRHADGPRERCPACSGRVPVKEPKPEPKR